MCQAQSAAVRAARTNGDIVRRTVVELIVIHTVVALVRMNVPENMRVHL